MAVVLLATPTDVLKRLRRTDEFTDDEATTVDTLLEEASVLVAGYLGERGIVYGEDDYPPDGVVICVSRMAARALTADPNVMEGIDRAAMGGYQVNLADPYTTSVYLGKGDKKWLQGIVPTAVSVPIGSERGGYDLCDDDA